jgi:hypothetical protein
MPETINSWLFWLFMYVGGVWVEKASPEELTW